MKMSAIYEMLQNYQADFVLQRFEKKECLLLQGDVADQLFFIKSGLVRLYHHDGQKETTLQFFDANQFVASFESFYLQNPSHYTIEMLEEGEVLSLSYERFKAILSCHQDIQAHCLQYVCERLFDYHQLFLSRLKTSPEERYMALLEDTPELLERVPHHYLASYLGVSAVSLSRIRGRVKSKGINKG